MPTTSVAGTIRTNLQTQLQARALLSGVTIYRHPLTDLPATESIVFGKVTGNQEHVAMGPSSIEKASLFISIRVRKPGGGETAADTAEDRALVLLGEVESQLRDDPKINTACLKAQISRYDIDLGVEPEHLTVDITAELEWEAHLT